MYDPTTTVLPVNSAPATPLPPAIDWRDVMLRNPRKFTSELVESAAQCAIWQAVSALLVMKDNLNYTNWKNLAITSTVSSSTVIIRALVSYWLDSLKADAAIDVSEICLETLVSLVANSLSNAVWQPGYDLAMKQEPHNPGMQMFITGVLSALFYFFTLMLGRAIISIWAKQYRRNYWTQERLAKDIAMTIFQVMPVAAYFVQTNGNYLISALKTTNSYWLDVARSTACGTIGYLAGYFVRALVYFVSCALPYACKMMYGFADSIYRGLCYAIESCRQQQTKETTPLLAHTVSVA